MAYYNRKNLLYSALKSFEESEFKDFEVIIRDDASNDEHKLSLEWLYGSFPTFNKFKLISIKPEEKTWTNSSVPYNKTFKMVEGDKVIIQNPESRHVTDVLSFVNKSLEKNIWFAMKSFALSPEMTNDFMYKSNKEVANIFKESDYCTDPYISYGGW